MCPRWVPGRLHARTSCGAGLGNHAARVRVRSGLKRSARRQMLPWRARWRLLTLRPPAVFGERRGTLDSSIGYLEDLASSYARISARGTLRPCDVNEIVRRVPGDARGRAPRARLRIEPTEGAVVRADPVALRRILENLVDNAVDALEEGKGRVTVSTGVEPGADDGPHVRIRVEDEGRGMTDAERARVFDDFYTTKPGGTGLGLSIVRRLVGDLGGSIRVEDAAGHGTRFLIDLPAEGAPAPTKPGGTS